MVATLYAASWDSSLDFSSAQNPSGVWTYGSLTTIGSALSPYSNNTAVSTHYNGAGYPGVNGWSESSIGFPFVARNDSSRTILPAEWLPGRVVAHPFGSKFSAIRWTAPHSMKDLEVSAHFRRIEGPGSNSSCHVILNGTVLGEQSLAGAAGSANFTVSLDVEEGDTLDFVVGPGIDGSSNTDGTEVRVFVYERKWDLESQFIIDSNPVGQWRFGSGANLGDFNLYQDNSAVRNFYANAGFANINGWSHGGNGFPFAARNDSSVTVSPADWLPGRVVLHPNTAGLKSIARWTAPSNLPIVAVRAAFRRIESGGTSEYHVLKNGILIGGGSLTNLGSALVETTVSLNPGDVLDFIVGPGNDGTANTDGTEVRIGLQAVGSTLSGVVTLEDYRGSTNGVPLTLFLRDPVNGSLLDSIDATLSSSGGFTIHTEITGVVDLEVFSPRFLRLRVDDLELVPSGVGGLEFVLKGGDANGDGSVNVQDFVLLRRAFGTTALDAGWDPTVDFNGDGFIGVADFLVLRKNFGRTSS